MQSPKKFYLKNNSNSKFEILLHYSLKIFIQKLFFVKHFLKKIEKYDALNNDVKLTVNVFSR